MSTATRKCGYIRVANIRGNQDYAPESDEVRIVVDRTHAILGNRHFLKNRNNLVDRHNVINEFIKDLDKDAIQRGPISREIVGIAKKVHSGDKVVLLCWCSPLPCHADEIAARVRQEVKRIYEI